MQIRRVLTLASAVALPLPMVAQSVPGVDVWMPTPATALAHRRASWLMPGPISLRITTDNHIIVISPRTPYGGYRIPTDGLRSDGVDVSFRTESADGVGHVFVAASYTPFDFSRVRAGGSWNIAKLGALPHSDPQAVADWFLRHIVPSPETPYGVNDIAYYVGVTPPSGDSQSVGQSAPQTESQNTVVDVSDYDNDGYAPTQGKLTHTQDGMGTRILGLVHLP